MKVGEYVKVIDATCSMAVLSMNKVVEIIEVLNNGLRIKIEGSSISWEADRFESLPILTEAPPKGSKVVKVEKSCNGSLDSDRYLGKVFTTIGEGGVFYVSIAQRQADLTSLE